MSRVAPPSLEPVVPDERRPMTPARKRRIWEAWGRKCWFCRMEVPMEGPQVIYDHVSGLWLKGSHKARPSNPQWFRDLRDQCAAAGVAYHHKQNGEWASVSEVEGPQTGFHTFPDARRVGKKASGRLLDGVTHDARPGVR